MSTNTKNSKKSQKNWTAATVTKQLRRVVIDATGDDILSPASEVAGWSVNQLLSVLREHAFNQQMEIPGQVAMGLDDVADHIGVGGTDTE